MTMNTPWGKAQTQKRLAPGITEVTTASHGGIHLHPTRNASVHEAWRDKNGWYEEDLEANIVIVTFPLVFAGRRVETERFSETWVQYADRTLRSWMPDQYEKVNDCTVTAEESFIRAEQLFAASVADKVVSTGAWGFGNDSHSMTRVPQGWVGVAACVGGRWRQHDQERLYFLVPEDEYQEVRPMVLDPQRHPVWEPIPDEAPDHPVTVSIVADPRTRGMEFDLYAKARPHLGKQVGTLWRLPRQGERSRWLAYRRVGLNTGAPGSGEFDTQEAALEAVGFTLPPFARVPQPATS